ncbi:MAG: (2Fe-2S) ferredoxin domain-containing protein [Candidatus Moranbacteria bacterium]|jgi:NADH:ubiquinone oxidoreductase subunit E|nr:(2Fe-2S) ferredoxin domain-containing protein [Candidatus Moranbacteria bacterium]
MNGSPVIKVCCSGRCKGRGSGRIFAVLEREYATEGIVEKTDECMGYCGMGPNVAVNGNILHQLHPENAAKRIREEATHPSPKIHGLGAKTIDDLDSVLDDLF